GDEAYRQDTKLRMWLELNDIAHVLAVPYNTMMVSARLLKERVDRLVAEIDPAGWQRLSCGEGAHGPPVLGRVGVPVRPLRWPGWGHWLLARRRSATRARSLTTSASGQRHHPHRTGACGRVPVGDRGMLPDREE